MDVVPNWYGGGVDVEGREDMDINDDGVNVEGSGVDGDVKLKLVVLMLMMVA